MKKAAKQTERKVKAYARAGVDIDLGNRVKSGLGPMLERTRRPEVLGRVGGFGGLFRASFGKHAKPVLVASVDGVGTKLMVASAMKRHDTIGADLVNHCVNDILTIGAEPLFFLDYVGTGQLNPAVFKQIVRGLASACEAAGCALIGGETAQMPGLYQGEDYDLVGTIVGVVDEGAMISGKKIRAKDAVIGLPANGLHTNGYSLARKILFDDMKLTVESRVPGLRGTLGEELLRVHRCYLAEVRRLERSVRIKGLAHITGGGLIDNLPRILPRTVDVAIYKSMWRVPRLFEVMVEAAGLPDHESYQTFNMGIGFVAIVAPEDARAAIDATGGWEIGEVIRGTGRVLIQD